jgi:cell division protein ZapA
MSQVTIQIGGRSFDVVCQEGEENFLHAAAALLNEEAQKLDGAGSRITENRMLLMAGLLLADRTVATEEKLAGVDKNVFSKATNSEIMDHANQLEVKLRVAEADLAVVKTQLLESQSDESIEDKPDLIEIDNLRKERDDAVATLRQIVDKFKLVARA